MFRAITLNAMADEETKETTPNRDVESEVWGAIAAFEQILEAIPDDPASLGALAHAYSQIGDHARATDYFVRLGDALISENDWESAAQLVEKLQVYAEDNRVRELIERIESREAGGKAAGATAEAAVDSGASAVHAPVPDVDVKALSRFKVAEDLSLAWGLMEADELTQDEYASVVQDLTELSAAGDGATVSVLHVLETRGFKGFDRVLGYLARETTTPVVALGSYEYHFPTTSALPLEFSVSRGAYAFDAVGQDLLVAVLNPYDGQLRIDCELVAGRTCHFYLALPSEFDQAITRYRETLEHGDDESE